MTFFAPLFGAGSIGPLAAAFLIACLLAFLSGFYRDEDRWPW